MINNKRGFLLGEETLKIIIAVIAIGLLVYLLFSIYYNSKKNEKLEQAEASLSFLISEVNAGSTEVEIFNPSPLNPVGWWYWRIRSFSSQEMPSSCLNLGWKSCLCICKEDFWDNNAEECDNEGVCRESELIVNGGDIEIKDPPVNLEIKNGVISEK